MNSTQCLDQLAALGQELRGVKFDLESIQTILDFLESPQKEYPTAIVAGTNGKGSTSAMLASILTSAGYRVGLYTSPHLVRVNERMRVNQQEISADDFAGAFTAVWQGVDHLLETKRLAT